MIEAAPVLTLRRNFPRPSKEAIAALSGVPTGFLVDALGGRGALHHTIKPLGEQYGMPTSFCGTVVTCACGPNDNMGVFGALDLVQEGDVIVAATEGFEPAAVIGDNVLGMAKNCGSVAFVTDGMVRDIDGIVGVSIPLFCAGVTPNSPACNGPATAGMPITLAGLSVNSGDIVAGDRDGVVVVPHAKIDAVIAKLVDIRAAEAGLEAKVKGGMKTVPHITELLASDAVKVVD